MIQESKSCSDVMKKHFNEKLLMAFHDWICDNSYVYGDFKLRDHYHITRKYRDAAQRDCNINIKLDHRIPVVFHNLKNYARTRQIKS